MSLDSPGRQMRVINVDKWPGGRRIIEGKAPRRCIHGRPLTCATLDGTRQQVYEALCRLCVWEVAHWDRLP